MTTRSLVAAIAMTVAAGPIPGNASTPATSFAAYAEIPIFAVITLPVDSSDVAPYVPPRFATIEVADATTINVSVAIFEKFSLAPEGREADAATSFAYSDLKIGTRGPEGSGVDSGGVLNLWRVASSPELPSALGSLGVHCGATEPPQTRACYVPGLTVATETSTTVIDVHADVPWGPSAYSTTASFVPIALPCPVCIPISGWHEGDRGPVRETPDWAGFPDSALLGIGEGTVRAAPGSPLFHMLGGRMEATGSALFLRGSVVAEFTLE